MSFTLNNAIRQSYADIILALGLSPNPDAIFNEVIALSKTPDIIRLEGARASASTRWAASYASARGLICGHSMRSTKEAQERIVRTGLAFENDANSTLAAIMAAIHQSVGASSPAIAAVRPLGHGPSVVANATALIGTDFGKGPTVRQLIKLLSPYALSILAISECAPAVALVVVMGYLLHGNWRDWTNDFGLSGKGLPESILAASRTALADPDAELVQHFPSLAMAIGMAVPAQGGGALPQVVAEFTDSTTDATTTKESTDMTDTAAVATIDATNADAHIACAASTANKLLGMPPEFKAAINAMLGSSGLNVDELAGIANIAAERASAAKKAESEMKELAAKLKAASARSAAPSSLTVTSTSASIPSGKMSMVMAETLFSEVAGVKLEVPHWTWDAPHPDVPKVDDQYIFRKDLLIRLLRCIARGENAWLQGHTGSGKTTFVEQVLARLGWPVLRVAMDSAVDRAELVGRMQLRSDGNGGTISEWKPGVLERAIPNNYVLLIDEMDAGHPNSLYTIQPILEGKGLLLLEDGGRLVPFAPMTRVIATGNTAGNGDESGLYPACRMLSAATLDRFPEFIEVPYLTTDEETALVQRMTGMSKTTAVKLAKFATEMRAAFTRRELPISYSPRRSIAFARAVEDYREMLGCNFEVAASLALDGKLRQATPEEHRPRLAEIARTCLGIAS